MLENIKAVIFDLDGTLVDSMWMWKQIDIDYMHSLGLEYAEDYQDCIEGMSFTETAVYTKERFHVQDSVEDIMKLWNSMAMDMYKNKVPYKKGAEDFLKYLKSRGIKTGIATSNSKELAGAVIDALNMAPYMDEIHTSCEVEKGKPAPDIYLLVAKCLGVDPSECLVFEDVINGIKAGQAAGMKVCAVPDDYTKDIEGLKKELADFYINDYTEVERI